MKNKILVLFLLCFTIIPIFNFVKASTKEDYENYNPYPLEKFNLSDEQKKIVNENGYLSILYTMGDYKPRYVLLVPKNKDVKFYIIKDANNKDCLVTSTKGNYLGHDVYSSFIYDSYSSLWNDYGIGTNIFQFLDQVKVSGNLPIYTDNTFTETFYEHDDTIGDPSSDLQISYQYNEDNTSCHIDATLKGGEFTDQIYYSNIAPSIAGQGLLTKKAFPKTGIDITENQALYFQAEDKDGNIKATNSISINKIGKLTPDCFNATFNFSKGIGTFSWVEIIPNLTLHQSPYYDIYYKIKTDNILDLTSSTGNLVTEYNRIDNNKKMVFNTITGAKFTIYFEIRNKDGSIALTKTYDIDLKAANVGQSGITGENENSGGSGISGGTVNGENDPNITNNDDYISNYEKMSLTELIETAKESFNTFRLAFSILPGYIWGSILILLGVVIALRILGR